MSVKGAPSLRSQRLERVAVPTESRIRSGISESPSQNAYLHGLTPFGSTTRIGFICGLAGGNGIVCVIWYSAQEPFFLAKAPYLTVITPGDCFWPMRLKCSLHPRISLMRHLSHRRPGMNVPPSPDFDRYASAISSFVGSFGGAWANTALNAASISAGTESFTPVFDVRLTSAVALASCRKRTGFVFLTIASFRAYKGATEIRPWNRAACSGVKKSMRGFRLATVLALVVLPLPATLIPPPNLAKRVEAADAIIVGHLISGTTFASGSQVSNDVVLHVDRILKGDIVSGTTVAAHLEGRGYFAMPNPRLTAAQPLYGIWFLSLSSHPYTILSRDGGDGELHSAAVILPEDAPAGEPGDTPAVSAANELAGALRWLAEKRGAQLHPQAEHDGIPEQRRLAAVSLGQFRALAEDLRTLSPSTTLPVYGQFATEKSAPLRAVGIAGLIAANAPEGVKRAAADWSDLVASADTAPIINSLMGYSNVDGDGVRALRTLALREPVQPGLRENAAYALRAIHTKEALPALVTLLDDKEERIRPYALSGLCLFVRNAPPVTPESVPSMSWLQSRQPAPFLNPETQQYCLLGGSGDRSTDLDLYAGFWKSWWQHHQQLLEQ